jgi:hypothetical protein
MPDQSNFFIVECAALQYNRVRQSRSELRSSDRLGGVLRSRRHSAGVVRFCVAGIRREMEHEILSSPTRLRRHDRLPLYRAKTCQLPCLTRRTYVRPDRSVVAR